MDMHVAATVPNTAKTNLNHDMPYLSVFSIGATPGPVAHIQLPFDSEKS